MFVLYILKRVMKDTFDDSFVGEGFNIVFVDDEKSKRRMVINSLIKRQHEFQLKLNFKTAFNCGYAIKLVQQLIKDNNKIDLILMDNDFGQAPIDCSKQKQDDDYIYKLCCNNNGGDNGNNGINTTTTLREIVGYMGPIYSISSQADKSEWVKTFIDSGGTDAIGRGKDTTKLILQLIDSLIKTPIQPYIPKTSLATIQPNILDTSLATTPPNILDTSLATPIKQKATTPIQQKATTPIKQKATQMISNIISEIIFKKKIVPENGGKKTKKRLKNKNKTNKRLKNGGKKPKK